MSDIENSLTNKSNTIEVDIEKEMKKSFLEYSMSVIVSRALPDVRDGLKPVHRRILYTLFENGLSSDKAYRKCADTVGTVLGRYHPHSDTSVYDAMVRLAQDFSMRYMLVDGHGNFGSVDGDPPAAYRYTESRMSKMSEEMLTDIEKETVDFVPNYDDRLKEPTVLPSRFPNLLANGSTGIAVGMATNIPPHNLGEVIDALCFLIDNPESDVLDLMKYIKGPDFPTGAKIMGTSGIKKAYTTGRGKITVRSCAEIVEHGNRFKIVITELPYQVNKARLCENIADLVKEKKLEGISNIEDHSDRKGMHVEITLKKDASPKVVLNKLYLNTSMQITYGIIMLAIVNGEPKILNLKDVLINYIDFQAEVITRRTRFDLKKASEREHILAGLKIALDFIDEVISILRNAKSLAEGKEKLTSRFNLDEIQAQAIVNMRLGQLTGLERSKIEEELKSLEEKIAELKEILVSKENVLEILKKELLEIKKKFSDERRTQIIPSEAEVNIEELIPQEDCILTFTNFGYIKRQKIDAYKIQNRGGKGILGMSRRDEDIATKICVLKSHDTVLFFTNFGKVYTLKCYEIPECSRTAKGTNIVNLLEFSENEKVTSIVSVSGKKDDSKYLIMSTKNGVIKRTNIGKFGTVRKSGLIAVGLDEGDELTSVHITNGENEILLATKFGMAIRFKETDIREMGRGARGVKAVKLNLGDSVVGFSVLNKEDKILTITETGYGRISDLEDYRTQSRAGKGLINYHSEKYGMVAGVTNINLDEDVIIIAQSGIIIRIKASTIRECSRPGKGVLVMRMNDGDKIVAIAKIPHEYGECDEIESVGE